MGGAQLAACEGLEALVEDVKRQRFGHGLDFRGVEFAEELGRLAGDADGGFCSHGGDEADEAEEQG